MNPLELLEQRYRMICMLAALVVAIVFISLCCLLVPVPLETVEAKLYMMDILFDRRTDSFPFPFTVQNVMWLLFFVGLGDLWVRYQRAKRESNQLREKLLPESGEVMLRSKDLVPIYKAIVEQGRRRYYFAQRLIERVILQFQSSRSIGQSNNLLNSSLELMQHEIELKYTMLRYVTWLIPTVGFIGTVIGIALSLSEASTMPEVTQSAEIKLWLGALTTKLGVAFNTTLVALGMSAILVFLLHIVQEKEELALNSVGQYCIDNLIIRLYIET